jgi:hypothetical protein
VPAPAFLPSALLTSLAWHVWALGPHCVTSLRARSTLPKACPEPSRTGQAAHDSLPNPQSGISNLQSSRLCRQTVFRENPLTRLGRCSQDGKWDWRPWALERETIDLQRSGSCVSPLAEGAQAMRCGRPDAGSAGPARKERDDRCSAARGRPVGPDECGSRKAAEHAAQSLRGSYPWVTKAGRKIQVGGRQNRDGCRQSEGCRSGTIAS